MKAVKFYPDDTKRILRWGRPYYVLSMAITYLAPVSGFMLLLLAIFLFTETVSPSYDAISYFIDNIFSIRLFAIVALTFVFSALAAAFFSDEEKLFDKKSDSVIILYHKERHMLSIFTTVYKFGLFDNKYDWGVVSSHYSDNHVFKYQRDGKEYAISICVSFGIDPNKLTTIGRDVLRQFATESNYKEVIQQRVVENWLSEEFNRNRGSVPVPEVLEQNPYGFQNMEVTCTKIVKITEIGSEFNEEQPPKENRKHDKKKHPKKPKK